MIEKNYWDQQVLNAMWQALEEGQLTINHEVDALFDSLESAFPVAGSKIDWNEVPGSVYLFSQGAKQADFEHFYHANAIRMGLRTPAFYLSDAALSFAIGGDVGSIGQHLPAILENPEHHYFAAQDFSWCMALTMEGDLNFGFRP